MISVQEMIGDSGKMLRYPNLFFSTFAPTGEEGRSDGTMLRLKSSDSGIPKRT